MHDRDEPGGAVLPGRVTHNGSRNLAGVGAGQGAAQRVRRVIVVHERTNTAAGLFRVLSLPRVGHAVEIFLRRQVAGVAELLVDGARHLGARFVV